MKDYVSSFIQMYYHFINTSHPILRKAGRDHKKIILYFVPHMALHIARANDKIVTIWLLLNISA